MALSTDAKIGIFAGIVVSLLAGIFFATDWPWWVHLIEGHETPGHGSTGPVTPGSSESSSASTKSARPVKQGVKHSAVTGMAGGCGSFQVFAQNRWPVYGAALREQPNVLSKQIGGFPGNKSITVNGWVHGRAAYPTNTPPWNNDVWYHLADGSGWVSFGGVRATPTSQDPSGQSKDGGPPATISSNCQGATK